MGETVIRNTTLQADRRGVSIAITHAITLGITAVLITGLLIGAGGLLRNQEDRAAQEQLKEVGSDTVTFINYMDDLNEGEEATASVQPDYPDRIVGKQYTIEIVSKSAATGPYPFSAPYALKVTSEALDGPIWYPLNTEATLDDKAEIRNGESTICLIDKAPKNEITMGENCP